jgi:TDP-4-amino-4,6-dideoxy-D-glucose deaminase
MPVILAIQTRRPRTVKSVRAAVSRELAAQVMAALAAQPFRPSADVCRQFGLTRAELQPIYAQARTSGPAQRAFAASPFCYLTTVLARLIQDRSRTLVVLHGKIPQPFSETLELFISAACDVNCSFCYRRDRDYGNQRILSTPEFVSIVHQFADVGGKNLDVSGGLEPLLSPAIRDVLTSGVARGLRVNLYTIGTALQSPKLADALLRLAQVRVSFTAHDKASYQQMMGADHFDRVTANLRELLKSKERHEASVGIGISYVVNPNIYRYIPKVLQFALDLGLEFLDLRSVSVWESADYTPEQRAELREILSKVRRGQADGSHGRLKISIADTFGAITDLDADPLPYLRPILINALVHYRITVTPAGKVYPLNILGQPTREDERFLIGCVDAQRPLNEALNNRRSIPFTPDLLLAHDKSHLSALSKLQADLEFGIGLEEQPFVGATRPGTARRERTA